MVDWTKREGSPYPLGVSWLEDEQAFNFAIYSKHAESVTLLFYREGQLQKPCHRYHFAYLENKSGPIWHCRIPRSELAECRLYAYQISGPEPGLGYEWHAFDAEKLLLDPYAKSVYFPPRFDREAARMPGSNEGQAPLGRVIEMEPEFDWEEDRPPRRDSDLVIYELHVKGFTHHSSSKVSGEKQGTFGGVIEKIPYLRNLGVTAVELMPIFQFDPQEGNYWGYMPLSLFSPHHAYTSDWSACNQHNEFREMVKHLHSSGIEVILDVVYNHTAEGDQHGPTYSYKGIDNSTYYILTGDPARPYQNYSGTGNTLHTANRAVRRLIIDSLRYWVREMHVDGFRFDLASVFARNEDGSVNLQDPPIFGEIAADPDLAGVRLIAEPWDASGVYQLGRAFPGQLWMQWNGSYRDTLQQFIRGDEAKVADLMTRIYGSSDLFPDDLDHAYHPWQSVNYMTSHDGSTLYDLVSYNEKHNWANGHGNTDGPGEFRWNCGWEGEDQLPEEVLRLRKQQIKNFCCLLFLSNGTPMFRMGDEFLQTQHGNNNPYNQDNETTWLDWRRLDTNEDVFRFFQGMIRFRREHPSISRPHFWRNNIHWYGADRLVDMSPQSHCLAYCLHGFNLHAEDLYVMINANPYDVRFGIYEGKYDQWRRVVDTAVDSPNDIVDAGEPARLSTHFYDVRARSVVVLVRNCAKDRPVNNSGILAKGHHSP